MVKQQLLFWKRDLSNLIAYGRGAPRHSQLIHVDPSECLRLIDHDRGQRLGLLRSGVVRSDRFWEEVAVPVREFWKSKSILSHWVDGVPWEDTRVYQRTLEAVVKRPGYERCFTPEDVARRYQALDDLYAEARQAGRIRTRQEVDPANPREMGAVLVHIGEHGEPIFGGEGFHRFCAALALEIPIPAVVGAVYERSLDAYRRMASPGPARPAGGQPAQVREARQGAREKPRPAVLQGRGARGGGWGQPAG